MIILLSLPYAMASYPIVDVTGPETLRNFAYKGKAGGFIGMTEDEVKAAVKSALEARSYDVQISWGQKSGPDIVARIGTARIVIEAKGEGRYRQMLGNYFLQALGQIIQRMDNDSCEYGIALPAHASYIELALKIPDRVRQALRLDFYFVRPSGTTYEVALLRWLVSGQSSTAAS